MFLIEGKYKRQCGVIRKVTALMVNVSIEGVGRKEICIKSVKIKSFSYTVDLNDTQIEVPSNQTKRVELYIPSVQSQVEVVENSNLLVKLQSF